MAQYKSLVAKLASSAFFINFELMYDALQELSDLSESLQAESLYLNIANRQASRDFLHHTTMIAVSTTLSTPHPTALTVPSVSRWRWRITLKFLPLPLTGTGCCCWPTAVYILSYQWPTYPQSMHNYRESRQNKWWRTPFHGRAHLYCCLNTEVAIKHKQ